MQGSGMLIFGAAGGIGSALCRSLASRGAKLFLAGQTIDKLQPLADELGGTARACDVTDSAQVNETVEAAQESLGRIDGVVLAVGSILLKPLHQVTDDEWRRTVALNLDSAFFVARAACKVMQRNEPAGGSIVLISSVAARLGLANHEAIAAVKAGVIGLTLSAAASYAPRSVRVNCVAPGLVDTPLAAKITGIEALRKASVAMHPLNRVGQPNDVVDAIEFFLDPANSWVTGQVLGVDGGLGSVRTRPGT